MINIVLLVVGSFMETIAALLILFPVLLRVAMAVEVDPIHFAVIMVVNLVIGLTTPPVGVCLFVAAGIGKITMNQLVKSSWPFLLVCLLVLLLVTYIPEITLWLPGLFSE
jgi:TRAP-type C4-dicarboxylate transport system permease large subunit